MKSEAEYKIVGKIGDDRLTPTMRRMRSGHIQEFREKSKDDKSFISVENADVVLIPPKDHYFASLIDSEWHWRNGCDICNNSPEKFGAYIRCEEHDVCCKCGVKRKDLKEIPWGHIEGFMCKKCGESEKKIKRQEALTRIQDGYDEYDYRDMDSIKCPWCDHEWDAYDSYEECDSHGNADEEMECDECGKRFRLTAHPSIFFSCSRMEDK